MKVSAFCAIAFLFVASSIGDSKIPESKYRLDKLTRAQDDPYTYVNETEQSTVVWNFRRTINVDKDPKYQDGCVIASNLPAGKNTSLSCNGLLQSEVGTVFPDNSGIRFNYEYTSQLLQKSKTEIQIFCAKDWNHWIYYGNNEVIVKVETPYGCVIKPAISVGWVFIIILVIIAFFYFAIGVPINFCFRDKRSWEVFPCAFFWLSIPNLVVTGAKFIFCP
ncbi:MAG: hypothetical protein EZS28_033384, partial [Streblomastix strix]